MARGDLPRFLIPAVYQTWTPVARDGARREIGQSNAMSMPLPFGTFAAALRGRGVPTVDAPPLDRGGMWWPLFRREPTRAAPVAESVAVRKRRVAPMVMQFTAFVLMLAAILRACAG